MILFYNIEKYFFSDFISESSPLDSARSYWEIHKDETRVICKEWIVSGCKRLSVLSTGYYLETDSLEALKSDMFTISPSMKAFVIFTIVNKISGIIIEFYKASTIALGISSEFITVSYATFIGGSDNPCILHCICTIPIQAKISKLGIVIVSTEVVVYNITVIVFVDIRGSSCRCCTSREPNPAITGPRRSSGLWRKIRINHVKSIGDESIGKREYENT